MKPIVKDHPIEPIRKAHGLPRRRSSVNLPEEVSDSIYRPAFAMQPDPLVCPHRRIHARVLLSPLCASLVILHHDHLYVVNHRPVPGGEVAVMETPAGQWHAVLSLDAGEVSSEVTYGPYPPITSADLAQWASGESEPEASTLPSWYGLTKPGECFVDA